MNRSLNCHCRFCSAEAFFSGRTKKVLAVVPCPIDLNLIRRFFTCRPSSGRRSVADCFAGGVALGARIRFTFADGATIDCTSSFSCAPPAKRAVLRDTRYVVCLSSKQHRAGVLCFSFCHISTGEAVLWKAVYGVVLSLSFAASSQTSMNLRPVVAVHIVCLWGCFHRWYL